jgi:hypothetical protein
MIMIQLKSLISEIAINEPVFNPSYEDVKIGDVYTSESAFTSVYVSTVLKVEPISNRFGKPDRIVSVKIQTWPDGNVIDHNKKIWVSQLLKGSV